MPVPGTMADLSTNEALNSPNGADPVGTSLDNYLRAYQAILRSTNAKGADIASAATTNIGAATGEFVTVTGSTTITSLGTIDAGIVRTVHFSGAPLLTYNATSLILPGNKNYQTAAGDVLQFRSLGSGNWRCVGISNPSNAGAVTFVDTVADMKALTGLALSSQVRVLGRVSVADGGMADYIVAAPAADNSVTAISSNDSLASFRLHYTGSINARQAGAVGDGVADDSPAFAAAESALPDGIVVEATNGNFYLGSNVTMTGRTVRLINASLTGPGRLIGALVEIIDSSNGSKSFGVGERGQFGSYYRFGRNSGGPIGLTIGGGDPVDGSNGSVVYPDEYGGWSTFQPTRYLSAIEVAVQSSSAAGAGTCSVGTNVFTRTSGAAFESSWVGRRIYIGEAQYLIATVNPGAGTMTVTDLLGGAVSFASAGPFTWVHAGILCTGTCNVSGTSVTRISGDPFIPITNTEYILKINGVTHTVSARPSPDSITLAASAGTISSASYELWSSVDDLISAFRVHRVTGAGFEENVTLGAYGPGYFHLHAAGGGGRQYPFHIGSGYAPSGAKRVGISLESDGNVFLGGKANAASLRVDYMGEVASNYLRVFGAASGGTPGIRPQGVDTNLGINITTGGTGIGNLSSNVFGTTNLKWSSTGLGFNGSAPIAKPTVTGSKGGNAALESLLTALSSYGLVTDSST